MGFAVYSFPPTTKTSTSLIALETLSIRSRHAAQQIENNPHQQISTAPPAFFSTISMADAKKKVNDAYAAAFPHGFDMIHTPGEGLLCGLRAIAGSIEKQLGIPAPELDDLVRISKDPGFKEFEKSLGILARENDDNFYVDQVGAILSKWGKEQKPPLNLQLGYMMKGGEKHLASSPDANSKVLWVYYTGTEKGGHYMGMKAKSPSTPPPEGNKGGSYFARVLDPRAPPPGWAFKSEPEKKRWWLAYNINFPRRHIPRNTDSEYTDDDSVSGVEDAEMEDAVAARDKEAKRSAQEQEVFRTKRARIDADIESVNKKIKKIEEEVQQIIDAQAREHAQIDKAEREEATQKYLNGIKKTINEQHKLIEALETRKRGQEEKLVELQEDMISLAEDEQYDYKRLKSANSKITKLQKQQKQFLRRRQVKKEEAKRIAGKEAAEEPAKKMQEEEREADRKGKEEEDAAKGFTGGGAEEAVSEKQTGDLQQLVRRIIKLREAEAKERQKNLDTKLLRPFSDDEYSSGELEAMNNDSETDTDDDLMMFSRVKVRVPKKNDPVPLDFDSNTATTGTVTREQVLKGLETLENARKEYAKFVESLNLKGNKHRRLGNRLSALRWTLRYEPDREDLKARLPKAEEAFAPYYKIEKDWNRKLQVIGFKTRQLERLREEFLRAGKDIPRIRRDPFGLSQTWSSEQEDKQSELNNIERKLKEQQARSKEKIKQLQAQLAEKEKEIREAEAHKKRVEERMGARRLKENERLTNLAEKGKAHDQRTAAADKRSDELRQREKRIEAEEDKAREAAKKAEEEAKMLLEKAQDELEQQKKASAAELARLEGEKRRIESEIAALKAAEAAKRLAQQEKEDEDRQAYTEAEEKARQNREPKAAAGGGDGAEKLLPPPPPSSPPPPQDEDDSVSSLYVGGPALLTAAWGLLNGVYRNDYLSTWMGPYINGGYNGMGTIAIFNSSSLSFLLTGTAALGLTFGWRLSKANS